MATRRKLYWANLALVLSNAVVAPFNLYFGNVVGWFNLLGLAIGLAALVYHHYVDWDLGH